MVAHTFGIRTPRSIGERLRGAWAHGKDERLSVGLDRREPRTLLPASGAAWVGYHLPAEEATRSIREQFAQGLASSPVSQCVAWLEIVE